MRRLAMNGASAAELLALSDELRDSDLVDLGVAVDDQEGSFFLPSDAIGTNL